MRSKKGTFVPKKCTIVHRSSPRNDSGVDYATAVAAALREELGTTHQAVKAAMRWTGASERTVKYWFAGSRGPSGEHLVALASCSDAILELFLQLAGRQHYAGTYRLADAHERLKGVVQVIQSIIDESVGR